MCGICGIIEKTGNKPDNGKIKLMLRAISHRGPDDEGIWNHENIV